VFNRAAVAAPLSYNRSAAGSDGGGLKKEAAQDARQRH
jgi:hypothetical protein